MASKNNETNSQNLIPFPNVKQPGDSTTSDTHFRKHGITKTPVPEPDAITFGALFQFYVEKYARTRTKSWQELEKNYARYFQVWTDIPCHSIRRRDVQSWVDHLADAHGMHTANRSHDTFRLVFNWGLRKEYVSCANPAIGIDRYKTKPRERFVEPGDELRRLVKAMLDYPNKTLGHFFFMCMYTGARKTNVMEMRWDEISLELKTWRIPDTKNGDSQTVALTRDALDILRMQKESNDSEWVFPSDRRKNTHITEPKKAWAKIIKAAGIDDLHIHDLRRTLGSYMAIIGISPTIIGKALGHKSPTSTAIYARLTQDPVRDAMEEALSSMSGAYHAMYEYEEGYFNR